MALSWGYRSLAHRFRTNPRDERIVARMLSAARFVDALEAPHQFEVFETAVL